MRALANLNEHPVVVFWEVTKACSLACRHCRATAIPQPSPDELDTEAAFQVIDQVAAFGPARPVLVLTGGDPLRRPDLFDLVAHSRARGVPIAMAPSVTESSLSRLAPTIAASGVRSIALSLDGPAPAVHDRIRGVRGHFAATWEAIDALGEAGLSVMLNTTVMRSNVEHLAEIAALVARSQVASWEVIFLVRVGRGTRVEDISPDEHEQVCHALVEVAQRDVTVRAAEAPFFRRVCDQRASGGRAPAGELYSHLSLRLTEALGPVPAGAEVPRRPVPAAATRDGKGVLFVSHNGEIFPAGFLPVSLGNVRSTSLAQVYRTHPLLRDIRAARFSGRCGRCGYSDLCGGSRARAFAATGDPLASDPACVHEPGGDVAPSET